MNALGMPVLISILLSTSIAGAQIRTKSVKTRAPAPVTEHAAETQAADGNVRYVYEGEETLADERAARPFSVGLGYINYEYNEPGVMKLTGSMVEIGGQFRHSMRSNSKMFVAADLRYADGGLHYDGGTQNLETGEKTKSTSTSKDRILNGQFVFGSTFRSDAISTVEFFGGIGRWQLNNKIAGPGSYGREAVYLYLPLGLNYARKTSNKFTLTTGVDLNVFLSGQTTSKMSDIAAGNPDIVHQQSSGTGYKLKVGGEIKVLPRVTLLTGLYYQVWNIDPSNVVQVNLGGGKSAGLVEPLNRTSMLGITAGAAF